MIRFRNWRSPNEKTQGRISPGVNRPWNSSQAEGTDDRPLCNAIPNRPVLVGCRCSDRRNHRHIADRRSVNANVGFGASSSESRMSLPSLWPSDTFLRSCPSKSNVRSGARCNSVVQRGIGVGNGFAVPSLRTRCAVLPRRLSSQLFPHRDWRANVWTSDIVNSPRSAK